MLYIYILYMLFIYITKYTYIYIYISYHIIIYIHIISYIYILYIHICMYVSSYCILLPVSAWSTMLFPQFDLFVAGRRQDDGRCASDFEIPGTPLGAWDCVSGGGSCEPSHAYPDSQQWGSLKMGVMWLNNAINAPSPRNISISIGINLPFPGKWLIKMAASFTHITINHH